MYKNATAQMRFKVVAGGQSYEVIEDADLVAEGWSSIVATWDDGDDSAYLYQNGEGTDSATVTNSVSGTLGIWLGSQAGGGSSAQALMANLLIYDQAMTEGQAESQHRAFLWADIVPGDEESLGATYTMTITYDYDDLYRLTSADYSGGAEYEYTYDAVGNRKTQSSPEGSVSYTYDAANRLTNVGGVSYTWNDNGNLTSDGLRSYSYDHANRLTQVTEGSLTTQIAYNGDGVRTSKTVSGDTTQYALDLAATLPVVISDTEAVYLYGLDILAQQQSERLYYMHDGLGSVRQLLDSTGDIATNYAYDPFGVPVVAGDASNPYRYTGEAWDGEVELLYLRARYYQPEVGRFVTRDPWPGDPSRPGTLNRYPYVLNSPVNYADPTGMDFTGPGPDCPDCGQYPVVTADTRVPPQVAELVLTAWVPHEILLGHEPDPYVLYQEMMVYAETGYSRRASLGHAELMLLTWLLPIGGPDQWFGPYNSLTRDVMNDPAIAWFKSEWAKDNWDLPFQRPYPIDGWAAFARENWELGMCVIGRGSEKAEGRIDPVGGILGTFEDIRVEQAGIGRVRFEVFNKMNRPSFGRLPVVGWWLPWHEEVFRNPLDLWPGDWWGTTVNHHFYWYENDPKGSRGY